MITRPAWVEVDLSCIAHNTKTLLSQLSPAASLMAVVKADGYGHGAVPVANTVLSAGARALAVALPEEGVHLREAGITAPILVLGAALDESASLSVEYRLIQTVFTLSGVEHLSRIAAKAKKPCQVHVKIDTGMSRIGLREEKELCAVVDALTRDPYLQLTGLFTHFAAADDEDLSFTFEQSRRFHALADPIKRLFPSLTLHSCNSAALIRCPRLHEDMVRPGLSLYCPPELPGSALPLLSAMSIKCRGVYVKSLQEGQTVGYSRTFTAPHAMRVMTLPIGYADGYHRNIGNHGHVLIHGQIAPVIGRVCMDQCMVDVTHIPQAQEGDEVVLLGRQGEREITAAQLASWCGMIDYEVLLSPSSRLSRLYLPTPSDSRVLL